MNLARQIRFQPAPVTARSAEIQGQIVSVRAPRGGIVREIRIAEGDLVSAGDVLVELSRVRTRRGVPAALEAPWTEPLAAPGLRASVSGRVVQVDAGAGDAVERSQPVVAILESDDVWITADFHAEDLEIIQPGCRASVRAGGVSFSARVEWIDPEDGAALLEFEEDELNPADVLLPGAPAEVTIDPDQRRLHLR